MRIDVFAKNLTSKDGRPFKTYSGKLTNKSGDEVFVNIKFREDAGKPLNNPCTIVVDKAGCNLVEKKEQYTDKDTGEVKEAIRRTLWVSKFNEEEFIDTSLDDYDFE